MFVCVCVSTVVSSIHFLFAISHFPLHILTHTHTFLVLGNGGTLCIICTSTTDVVYARGCLFAISALHASSRYYTLQLDSNFNFLQVFRGLFFCIRAICGRTKRLEQASAQISCVGCTRTILNQVKEESPIKTNSTFTCRLDLPTAIGSQTRPNQ